tara:strand:- start:2359 stop:2832 length:474 start_codon:yes stop_codon:yes gene_type:complete
MAYLIFDKHKENEVGSIISIAENETDRDNLNLFLDTAKVITIDTETFQNIQLSKKEVLSYNGDTVTYANKDGNDEDGFKINIFKTKEPLEIYINNNIERINQFLNNNESHPDYSKWNSYKSQLEGLNLDSITYPLNKTLEEHFLENSQTVLHPLQLP